MRAPTRAAATIVALSTIVSVAHADDKIECLDAYEGAQRVRQEGKLRAARTSLTVCARDVCPGPIRKDCGTWLDEVEQAIPTVILRATGEGGEDLRDVRVTMDGEEIASSLTGTAVPIDPGPHRFVFVRPGRPPVAIEKIVAEGDKRHVVAMPALQADPKRLEPAAPKREEFAASRPVPVMAYVFGGVALGGVAGFGYFAAQGASSRSDLDACRPYCAAVDIDASQRNFVIGDVFLGVGVAAAVGAAVFYVTRPSHHASASRAPGVVSW